MEPSEVLFSVSSRDCFISNSWFGSFTQGAYIFSVWAGGGSVFVDLVMERPVFKI